METLFINDEPLFFESTLFDTQTKGRISENFKKQKFIPNLSVSIKLKKIEDDSFIPKRYDPSLFHVLRQPSEQVKNSVRYKISQFEDFTDSCESLINKSDASQSPIPSY